MLIEIPLSRPELGRLERQYVEAVLASERLALGPFTARFEAGLATLAGTRHAIAVNGGTAALHLILRSLGIGPGDEVITTPYSFIASSNAVLYVGATLRLVDIRPDTFNIDVAQVEAAITPKTKAILAVDVFGCPADWHALTALAKQHGLFLIDDACEGLGATIGDQPLGSFGHAAAFGFYPNKQVTTGEGGCITTNSDELASLCRSLRNQGRADDGLMEHVALGYNYRMPELSAALGCAQLERFAENQAQRARVAATYAHVLAPLANDLHIPVTPAGTKRSWFVYVLRLSDQYTQQDRDQLMHLLQTHGVACSPYFPNIHLQPYYRERFGFRPGDFPVCEATAARTIGLPLYPQLRDDEIAYIGDALRKCLTLLPASAVYVQS